MSYQVLARKWRPQDFAGLIGQEAVVTALSNALRDGRVAQAYLFSGIRGVGKTTAARVFAKALNCEKGPAHGPCNECAACREITAGTDMDVLEIDAATYSKVEQVRELAESLRYGPARDPYKVVVLDEVHRLSRQAFDALLKIIEEPPPRLVFIFATTEVDAVPATILSRCQEFHFRRVAPAVVAAHLAEIARAEGLEASPRALAILARAGEGSVRDSVALLDQLATFGGGKVAEEDAVRLLGGLDLALFARLLAAIVAGESAEVSAIARQVEAEGWDPREVSTHFLAYVRDALHAALGDRRAAGEMPGPEAEALAAIAARAGYENLLRLLQQLLASEASIRRSESGTLALEIAWLRAAELPKLVAIEEVLAREENAPAPPSAPRPAGAGAGARSPQAREEKAAAPALDADPAASRPEEPAGPLAALVAELSRRRPTLAAQFEAAGAAEWTGTELVLRPSPTGSVALAALERPANRALLDEAIATVFGRAARWRVVAPGAGERPAREAPDPVARASEHPAVQTVLRIFGGRVASVEPSPGDGVPPEDER